MDGQREITGTERRKEKPRSQFTARAVRWGLRELMRRPCRCQMGLSRDGLWIKSWAEKGRKEKDQFQCFFPTCQTSLMDILTVIKKKKTELLIPSGTLPNVVWRESTSKSDSKSHWFTLSRRETPARYMILCISPESLCSTSPPLLLAHL